MPYSGFGSKAGGGGGSWSKGEFEGMEVCREETVVDTPFSDSLDDPEENKVIYITEGIKNKVPECSILIYVLFDLSWSYHGK